MASLLDNITRPSAAILQLSVLLGVIFVLLKVLQFYWERKKLIKALEAFPGPPKHWLYGHNHLVRIAGLSQGGFVPVRMEKDWMGCACALLLSPYRRELLQRECQGFCRAGEKGAGYVVCII